MSASFDRRRQRGDMLLESLVGVLLLSILGAGMANVAGRVLNAQHETRVADLAVVEMRRMLQQQGESLCDGPASLDVTLGDEADGTVVPVQVECPAVSTAVSIAAPYAGMVTVHAPRAVQLSVLPEALGLEAGGAPLTVGTQQ